MLYKKFRVVLLVVLAAAAGYLVLSRENAIAVAKEAAVEHVDSAASSEPNRAPRPPFHALSRISITGQPAPNYLDLQRRAYSGDQVAQRELAFAYSKCFSVSMAPQVFEANTAYVAAELSDPAVADMLLDAAQGRMLECGQLDDGQIIPREAVQLLAESAASRGDVAAQAMSAVWFPSEEKAQDLRSAWSRAVENGDALALYTLADATSTEAFPESLRGVVNSDDAGLVMTLAACRLGLDCGPGGGVMQSLCLDRSFCSKADFETAILTSEVKPDQRLEVMRQVDDVMSVIFQSKGDVRWDARK